MAANTLLTIAMITKEFQRYLHNNLGFIKSINREYSKEFANSGAKIGASINVRNPFRSKTGQGAAITPQSVTETSVPLTVNRQWNTSLTFGSAERSLSLDDYAKRYIAPAAAKMASDMDLDCLYAAITGSYKFTNPASGVACPGGGPVYQTVGTVGTTPGTGGGSATGIAQYNAPAIFLNAGRVLNDMACPDDGNRHIGLSPAANAASVAGLTGMFNPQGIISEQYKKGYLGDAMGFKFYMDQNMPTITTGTRAGSPVVDTSAAAWTGSTTTPINTLTTTGATNGTGVKVGEVFTIGTVGTGIVTVNPENQQATGLLQQFVVTAATADISTGSNNITFSPAVKLANGVISDGNCVQTGTAGSLAINFLGSASSAFANSLAYHSDAFTLATVDLELASGADYCAREVHDGISLRVWKDSDIMSDQQICRVDVLGGFSVLRPELAVRLAG